MSYVPIEKCNVTEAHVTPCKLLNRPPFELITLGPPAPEASRARLVAIWSDGNLVPLKVCPFCGERLDAPAEVKWRAQR